MRFFLRKFAGFLRIHGSLHETESDNPGSMRGKHMSTRAIGFLTQKGTPFDIIKYEHLEKGARYAAELTGFPLEKTIKTLVVDVGNKQYALALMPGNEQLDVKKFAAVFDGKKAALVEKITVERLTGYFVGGISPFGLKRTLPAVMHETILSHDTVMINGGQRGTMLKMRPEDIVALLKCSIRDIAREEKSQK
jgi:Cys-tRNA(Pro)/Cys-tRNA(Cys) deacylase